MVEISARRGRLVRVSGSVEQTGRHQRQGRVLGAADRNLSAKTIAALNDDLIHFACRCDRAGVARRVSRLKFRYGQGQRFIMPTPGMASNPAITYESGPLPDRPSGLVGVFAFARLFLAALQIGAQRLGLAGAAFFLAAGRGLPSFSM